MWWVGKYAMSSNSIAMLCIVFIAEYITQLEDTAVFVARASSNFQIYK